MDLGYLIVGLGGAAIGAAGGVRVAHIRVNERLRLEHEREDRQERVEAYRNLLGAADRMMEHDGRMPTEYDDIPLEDYNRAASDFDRHLRSVETSGSRKVLAAARRFREAPTERARCDLADSIGHDTAPR